MRRIRRNATVLMNRVQRRASAANASVRISRQVNYLHVFSLMMLREPMTVPLKGSSKHTRKEDGGGSSNELREFL